ncbi:MAG: Efflux ABC transporter, ATP-binding protein [uncultured Thermomicrobiales bacterium]|uniref:Efflux ABC transporter, ATP-binding protein n=1 Tax=uncultured Thermomicrobiales bacterium TaxID=1645740 RepID=A0A6J4U796_9BACT|nr:MAG: Efflux ABC transporter, ATP-binding protein [uncultured Thermomicrobiales bacterium]
MISPLATRVPTAPDPTLRGAATRDATISVRGLRKTYAVPEREAGAVAAVRSLVRRTTREVPAVADVGFAIAPGEVVGFLGPNGAGKTTTLKVLAGLLHPSAGEVTVLGHVPWRRDRAYLAQITLVMGQRNQLHWDIPVGDSFVLNRAIYRIPERQYRETVDELVDLLGLEELLPKPVRNLSLGERMKCELAAALLHRPRVLFLDEPTLGLDVSAQRRIRAFVAEYNRRHEATVLLTSHYMADVEALCQRVIVIHRGRLLYDGDLTGLVARFAPDKTVVVELAGDAAPELDLAAYGEVVRRDGGQVAFRVPKAAAAAVVGRLLAELPVVDLTVEDPPVEDIIERVFREGGAQGDVASPPDGAAAREPSDGAVAVPAGVSR